jgi:hypothetical protein
LLDPWRVKFALPLVVRRAKDGECVGLSTALKLSAGGSGIITINDNKDDNNDIGKDDGLDYNAFYRYMSN